MLHCEKYGGHYVSNVLAIQVRVIFATGRCGAFDQMEVGVSQRREPT